MIGQVGGGAAAGRLGDAGADGADVRVPLVCHAPDLPRLPCVCRHVVLPRTGAHLGSDRVQAGTFHHGAWPLCLAVGEGHGRGGDLEEGGGGWECARVCVTLQGGGGWWAKVVG